ncbi:MAG: SemiSWEET family transporter [bacterium]|nr:SemiSWEET family transporter [bacterium]
MSYVDISRLVTFVASLTITLGIYSQVWKIWKTKSAKDFSIILILGIVITELAWLNYGIVIKEWPIIALESINIPGVIIMAVLFFKYKN